MKTIKILVLFFHNAEYNLDLQLFRLVHIWLLSLFKGTGQAHKQKNMGRSQFCKSYLTQRTEPDMQWRIFVLKKGVFLSTKSSVSIRQHSPSAVNAHLCHLRLWTFVLFSGSTASHVVPPHLLSRRLHCYKCQLRPHEVLDVSIFLKSSLILECRWRINPKLCLLLLNSLGDCIIPPTFEQC